MEQNIGNIIVNEFAYLNAKPAGKFINLDQIKRWHCFVKDFVLQMCANGPIILIYGKPYESSYDNSLSIPSSRAYIVRSSCGKAHNVYELAKMTPEIFQKYIIESEEFFMNIELFIWKPNNRVEQVQIQEIIDWRDAMFYQSVPFSRIVVTDKCLGFPSSDGEEFFWMNPDAPSVELKSIAKLHDVEITKQGFGPHFS